MADPVSDIARTAAARLEDTLAEALTDDVEAELEHAAGAARAYADPVSIASLIVAIASLAWSIYTELRRPHRELAGAVRQRWAQDHVADATAGSVIDIVAEEKVKRGER